MKKNFEEFCNYIRDNISHYLKFDVKDVIIDKIQKQSCVMTAINIRTNDVNMSANVYLDDFYNKYRNDEKSLEDILNDIAAMQFDVSTDFKDLIINIANFDTIKDKICYRLISNNLIYQDYLSTHAHLSCTDDIDYIYYINIQTDEDEDAASIVITYDLLDTWNVSMNTLHDIATVNMQRLKPAKIKKMSDILMNFISSEDVDNIDDLEDLNNLDDITNQIVVVTNRHGVFGATAIFYAGIYDLVCKMLNTDELYIIPSSVHEVLCVNAKLNNVDDLLQMTKEVNTTLTDDDFLADNVYTMRNGTLVTVVTDFKRKDAV